MQDFKDGSGLQLIKFDFVTGAQEIKLAVLVEFWLFKPLFVSSVNICFLSSLLANFSSYFKIIKQRIEASGYRIIKHDISD